MNASYRLQLHPDFGFEEVRRLVPYFARLGVSHLYLSPITEAHEGSTHGYDVTDHNEIRDELGGRAGFDALLAAARAEGLSLILDFVPNHAGVGAHNPYWQDVLAYGPHARYASYFDVDWNPPKSGLRGKILLPFLGRPYGEALDEGELRLAYRDGRLYAAYYENLFALSPASYDVVLEAVLPTVERTERYFDVKDLHESYAGLEPHERTKAEGLRTRLAGLAEAVDLEGVLETFEADALHVLLERQFWRLAYWKTAGSEINYRRFFDINGLVGLRMENPDVFWHVHRLMAELVTLEGVEGLRIDHVDGLFDPHGYLERLGEMGARKVWVEKILAPGEVVPEAWRTVGTTGYEFMNDAMGVLAYAPGERTLLRSYRRFVDEVVPFEREVHRSKRLVMNTSLASELFRLAAELDRISEADYRTRDFTFEALREALAEIVAAFPRYRTYLPHDAEGARAVIGTAIAHAKRRNRVGELSVYDFIETVLTGDVPPALRDARRSFVGHFQQYTAPVAAKGVEDTAFYRYVPLAALNEVGGEPEPFGVEVQAFHARARFRAYRYPENLLATATHDHKRGEDARMRLIALAELGDAWDDLLAVLAEEAEAYRASRPEAPVRDPLPSRNDTYLFAQLLVALWEGEERDSLADRLATYLRKAVREAKLHSSWLNPDPVYEDALEAFVRHVLHDDRIAEAVAPLAEDVARHGFANGLAQLVLKLTTPGVPDLYQGTELFDLSLVDPDNRRPVDYERRSALLADLEPLLAAPDASPLAALYERRDERLKLYVVARLLRFRREHPGLFAGEYVPLEAEGDRAEHLLAFAREGEGGALVVAVPRWPAVLERSGGWGDTRLVLRDALAGGDWTDLLTGERFDGADPVPAAERTFPFVVLFRAAPDASAD